MTELLRPERPRPGRDESAAGAEIVARVLIWIGVGILAALAILCASVVLGLAVRIFVTVSGVVT